MPVTNWGIIHTEEDHSADIPESWNNCSRVISDKAKYAIHCSVLWCCSHRRACCSVLTLLTSYNPPRALQRLQCFLQKSVRFSCKIAGGLSAVTQSQQQQHSTYTGASKKWKPTTHSFLKHHGNLSIHLKGLFHRKESFSKQSNQSVPRNFSTWQKLNGRRVHQLLLSGYANMLECSSNETL